MKSLDKFFSDNIEAVVVALIGFVTILSNSRLQKKNIAIAAKQQLYEQAAEWMREIRDKLGDLAADYNKQARKIAAVSDGVTSKELQGNKLEEEIGKRYDHLQHLLNKSWEVRKEVRVLLDKIEAVPVLTAKIDKPLKALKKEYDLLDKQLSRDFDRILAVGSSITPDQKHFEVFAKDIIDGQQNLYQFADLIGDLEVLVNNVLVKDIYGERSLRPPENRTKQLTINGVIDPQI